MFVWVVWTKQTKKEHLNKTYRDVMASDGIEREQWLLNHDNKQTFATNTQARVHTHSHSYTHTHYLDENDSYVSLVLHIFCLQHHEAGVALENTKSPIS